MGRGVHFNHKRKDHEQEKPEYAHNASPKDTERVEYEINTVAKEGKPPIYTKVNNDL